MPDIDIGWKVKLDELQSQLRASGALSNNEIRKLVGEMRSQFKKAESDAAKSAKNAAKEWDKKLGEISGAGKQMASLLGGSFGQLGNIVFELGGKLGGVLGPVGLAAAGVAALGVGTVSAANALHDFVQSADPAIARLKQIAGSGAIPDDTIAALDDYRQSTLGAEVAATQLHVAVAAMAADAFEPAIATLAGLLSEVNKLSPGVTKVGEAVDFANEKIRFFVGFMTFGAAELVRFALGLDSVIGSALGFETLAEKGRDAAQSLTDLNVQASEHDQAVQNRIALTKEAAEEAEFEKNALVELGMVVEDNNVKATKRLGIAKEAAKVELAAVETMDEREARNAQYLELSAKIAKQDADAAEARKTALQEEADFKIDLDARVKKAQQEIDAIARAEIDRRRGLAADALQSTSDLAGAMSSAISAAAEDGTVSQKQAALTLFRVSQATAVAAAAVDAIRAGVALIPGYAFLGPGAPAAAAATAGAAFATASAGILSQSPPSFQRGGMVAQGSTPDHRVIQARADEAVLTGRGVRALGGPTAVEAVNRGGGSQAQPTIVNLHVDGRKLATARVDPLGSLLTGAPLGRRPLYG